jgi:FkbM family methyltransferase
LIIDCGANVGLSAIWFAKSFPAAEVYAVEPSPESFAVLQRNVRGYPLVRPLLGGIWDRETALAIVDANAEPWMVQVEEAPVAHSRSADSSVLAFTMDGIRRMASESDGIFIAKIDIEGAEQSLFRSNTDWVSEVDVLIMEPHDRMLPGKGSSNGFIRSIAKLPLFDYLARDENIFVIRSPATWQSEAGSAGAETSDDVPALASPADGPSARHR